MLAGRSRPHPAVLQHSDPASLGLQEALDLLHGDGDLLLGLLDLDLAWLGLGLG